MSTRPTALLLSGSLGMGHEMLVRSCASLLESAGWRTRSLDCMSLLGARGGPVGQRVFNWVVSTVPGVYDGLHFAHLRTGSPLAMRLDASSSARLVPALRAELDRDPADLILSVFATGASAAAKLKPEAPSRRTAVLCTDVTLHSLWVAPGTDLFLATSPAAAASVLRRLPRAHVAVIPPPVRQEFYEAPSRAKARAALGLPQERACVLFIDSGWGLGPLGQAVAALARAGVEVLAVAGHRREVEARFRALASDPRVHPFGFVDDVPLLMAAADLVIAPPGATTCGEARVVGRPLLLLDVMPGHGRENLLHETEQGGARSCGPSADDLVAAALAFLDETAGTTPSHRPVPRWQPAFAAALASVGLDLGAPADGTGADRPMAGADHR